MLFFEPDITILQKPGCFSLAQSCLSPVHCLRKPGSNQCICVQSLGCVMSAQAAQFSCKLQKWVNDRFGIDDHLTMAKALMI